jgi:hydrogenase maturation protease
LNERIVVLGIGNLLNSDEGFGVHAVRLAKQELAAKYPQVYFVDGGTLGLNLLPLIEEATHLLLLDCINAQQPSNTLVELGKDQIPFYSGIKISPHQTTLQEVLGLADIRDRLPRHLYLIGAQPISLKLGMELSPQVQDLLPQAIDRIELQILGWMRAVINKNSEYTEVSNGSL